MWSWNVTQADCSELTNASQDSHFQMVCLVLHRYQIWGPELLVIQLEDLLQPHLRLAARKLSMIGNTNEQKTSDTPFKFNFKDVFFWNIIIETRQMPIKSLLIVQFWWFLYQNICFKGCRIQWNSFQLHKMHIYEVTEGRGWLYFLNFQNLAKFGI